MQIYVRTKISASRISAYLNSNEKSETVYTNIYIDIERNGGEDERM